MSSVSWPAMPVSSTDCRQARPGDAPALDPAWLQRLHATAVKAARAAGRIQKRHFGGELQIDAAKRHDLKLAVDRHCQQAMVAVIQKDFPDHGILAEEKACLRPEAAFRWYLDPLDGTLNYALGLPHFCACAACYFHPPGQDGIDTSPWEYPLTGVVYAPVLDQRFEALAGGSGLCNGRPIAPGQERELQEAVVGFSFGSDPVTMRRMHAISGELAARTRKMRLFGATGLDLAYVASGRLSGLVQGCVRAWDFAAARVILAAAGGYFRAQPSGPGQWQIVAAAPGIGPELQAVVDRQDINARR